MTIQKVKSGRVNNIEADRYVGEIGQLFYNESLGDLRLSDGVTPGGISILSNVSSGGSGTGNANIYSGTSSPSPSSNMLWYNPSTDVLKIYIAGTWQAIGILVGTGLISSNGIVSTDISYISNNISIGSGITRSGNQLVLDMSYIGSNISIGSGLQQSGGQISVNMSYILSNIPSGNASIYVNTISPSSPSNNMLWYNPSTNIMQVYTSGSWKLIGISSGTGIISSNGQVSIDMSYINNNISIGSGLLHSGNQLVLDMSYIMGHLQLGSGLVVNGSTLNLDMSYISSQISSGNASIYSGSSAPSSPIQNMLWYNTSSNILSIYLLSNWVSISIGIGTGLVSNTGIVSIDMSYISNNISIGNGLIRNSGVIGIDPNYISRNIDGGVASSVYGGIPVLDLGGV